jgi:mRNA capping enzyme/mRNA capping enzyme, catalytic domain/mRNA capping enzyme, C-terminal domain
MDRTKESIKNLSSALSIYEKLLHKKYDRTSRENMEEYDLRMSNSNIECEVRFNRIDKSGFENAYKRLLSYGFVKTSESYQLKIMHYMDKSSSKIRCELNDLTHIKEFCNSNTLPEKTNYVLKDRFPEYMNYYENRDFNFRLAIQKEYTLDVNDPTVSDINLNWNSFDKSFRYMNRIEMSHPDFPSIRVDLSIVKSNLDDDGKLVREKQFSSSRLFEQPETYEIEIELYDTDYIIKNMGLMTKYIQKVIKYVTCGLQNTDYPIPYRQQRQLLNEYNNFIHKDEKELKYINNKLFIGPSSYTLQLQNITRDPENTSPNILTDFCVTEKADGERRLCVISKSGQIYFIDMNMRVQYTGAYTNESSVLGTIIDGEFISKDKTGKTLNLYAAFDLYFQETRNYRTEPFYKSGEACRYTRLLKLMKALNAPGNIKYETEIDKVIFEPKHFNMSSPDKSIMKCCADLFGKISAGTFRYNTDGLIFTSMTLGVGMEKPGDTVPDMKYTWGHSFKWKPPEFNTIDFLIEVKKDKGKDEIVYISSDKNSSIDSYKIINLYVGHDSRQGMINTQQMLFNDELPVVSNEKNTNSYKKVLFVPSSPYEPQAYIAYIPLLRDSSGTLKMFTEEGEVIEDDTIIEFKYVMKDNMKFNWVPLRIRHDKTAEYRETNKNFGNNYTTANSNWNSIHNPVTTEMLTDETLTIDIKPDDDVYYNRGTMSGKSLTTELRNFHNWHVKELLLTSVIQRGSNVIDYACGQGGDIKKWEKTRPKFVLGIDIARDNIHNPISGICARYLNLKARKKNLFHGLFIRGNTSKLIMREEFADTEDKNERDEEISKFVIQQVFATKPKSEAFGKYIPSIYGIAKNKFDVGSIQFALHYMFENITTLHSFLKNISDTIKVGGYFVGTCFDGEVLFNKLKTMDTGETYYIYRQIEENNEDSQERKKIWSVTKKYNNSEFVSDDSSLGMKISVFQETINKEFDEYLVNFNYLIECLKQYGFEPELKIPGTDIPGIANFKVIYDYMSKGMKIDMSKEEKEISFLNKYFVFKKTRNIINTDGIYRAFVEGNEDDTILNQIGRPVKLNKMIILK